MHGANWLSWCEAAFGSEVMRRREDHLRWRQSRKLAFDLAQALLAFFQTVAGRWIDEGFGELKTCLFDLSEFTLVFLLLDQCLQPVGFRSTRRHGPDAR